MKLLRNGAAALMLVALAGCQMNDSGFGGSGGTDGFGGSGGSGDFGGSGGSFESGERLARQICREAIRNEGQQVVENYRTRAVDYPYRGAGVDLYFSTRRDPMTVSLSYVRCRFMYETRRPMLANLKRP